VWSVAGKLGGQRCPHVSSAYNLEKHDRRPATDARTNGRRPLELLAGSERGREGGAT
jgi:hypothetical protein